MSDYPLKVQYLSSEFHFGGYHASAKQNDADCMVCMTLFEMLTKCYQGDTIAGKLLDREVTAENGHADKRRRHKWEIP